MVWLHFRNPYSTSLLRDPATPAYLLVVAFGERKQRRDVEHHFAVAEDRVDGLLSRLAVLRV